MTEATYDQDFVNYLDRTQLKEILQIRIAD